MMMSTWTSGRWRPCVLLLVGAIGGVGAAPTVAKAADAPAAARHVDINEYFVEGNTVLSDPEIEQAVYPFLGPDRTLDDVEQARAALQKLYEARGFKTALVDIPQQDVRGGRVRLLVTEARIGTVAVQGEKHTSSKSVVAALPALTPGTVPNLDAFSSQLTTLNGRSADRQVTPQLKAGAQPGTVDVDLAVDDKLPLHGGIEFNNKYSRDTTRTRLQANLRYDDLWGLGHSISGFYSVAPQRRSDSEVFVGSYGLPLGDTLRLDITGLVSNSDVSTIGSTDVLGDGHSVTAVLTKTLPSHGGLFHRITLSIAYKDFKEDDSIVDGSAGTIDVSKAPITYYPIAIGYAGSWTDDRGTLGYSLTGTFAIRGLGSGDTAFDNKRYLANGGFAYLHAGLNYLWNLPRGAQLYESVEGQISTDPLISNEEMAIGGAGSVRGYLQSEAIGDNGLVGSVELRSPSFAGLAGSWASDLRAIAFVDWGRVWLIDPLPEQISSYGLLSVGAGLRTKFANHLSGDVDLGFPLTSGEATRVGTTRMQFRISADF